MPLVELKEVTRVYRTGSVAVHALRGIDMEVAGGEFLAVMGQSGSGKSTLMNILGCLDRPSDGTYLLSGEDVSSLGRDRLASFRNRTIGFVFQAFHLLPRTTALENVQLPLLYREEELSWKDMNRRAVEALDIVGLADRHDHTPNELSGGQKQRVAIARALVTRPDILLADEPTGNLDSRTSLEIMDVIQNLNREGLTVIMVTHEPEMARFADRIVQLRDGLVRSDKTITRVQASDALKEWKDESDYRFEQEIFS